jgi:nitrite reductase/ring-hydroxylating ferredoxin subunit
MIEYTFHKVLDAAAIASGEMRHVEIGARPIVVYNLAGEFYATDDLCTHEFAFLSDGTIDGDIVECPLHGGKFEIKTGRAAAPPCSVGLTTYPVEREGPHLLVGVPLEAP